MLDSILSLDRQLFLVINGAHCSTLDPIMVFFSGIFSWVPLYLAIIFFLFWKHDWRIGLSALLAVLLTFALTDQLSVHLFKDTVQRLRPCHEADLFVHLLEGCGGRYGFLSSHAASTFGLATITALFFRKKYYTVGIYFWAAMVGYSRIYVGKHYPLDVLCGAIFGALIGLFVYQLYRWMAKKVLLRNSSKIPFNTNKKEPLCKNLHLFRDYLFFVFHDDLNQKSCKSEFPKLII